MPRISRDRMYQDFMAEIQRFVEESSMFSQPIQGASEEELVQIESRINKKFPPALRAWYQRFGHYPGDWSRKGTYQADLTIRDLLYAVENASRFLSRNFANPWEVSRWVLPFSNDISDKFWCVWLDMGDDPPIYLQDEGDEYPHRVAVSFSAYIREVALGAIGGALYLNSMDLYHDRFMESTKDKTWEERSKLSELRIRRKATLWYEIEPLRKQFIERIHTEDVARRRITSPEKFQERWVNEFSKMDLARQVSSEEIWIYWNWTLPQKDAWGTMQARRKAMERMPLIARQ